MNRIIVAVGTALGFCSELNAQAPSFTIFPSGGPLQAWGMSADGDTLVGSGNFSETGNLEAWRWNRGTGIVHLNPPGATARAVSADGSIIAGIVPVQVTCLWNNSILQTYPGNQGLGANIPWTMSASGKHIVARVGSYAVRWSPETGVQYLGTLPGFSQSAAEGVSGNGTIVVGSSFRPDGAQRAFRWEETSTMDDLGTLPGFDASVAHAASVDGTVIVGRSFAAPNTTNFNNARAFRWTASTGMRPLSSSQVHSYATSASQDGSVIVGFSGGSAFVWTPLAGMQNFVDVLHAYGIAPTNFTISQRIWVSANGRKFGGSGISASNAAAGWAAELPVGFGCYANCDGTTNTPVLTANDFSCFLSHFLAGDSYANCDDSAATPVLTVNDFQCFVNKFALGCQ